MRPIRTVLSITVITALAGGTLAGPLNPPAGPVSSTFKTLAEVEPRVAINATNTPGDAGSVFKITQPGSYYLTSNLTGQSGKCGILIVAQGTVTIDLNGFELVGVPTSTYGVFTGFGIDSMVRVRNGAARAWGVDGINLSGDGSVVESVRANANAGSGISVGDSGIVRDCVSGENVVFGIDTGGSAVVEGCTALDNINSGIHASHGAAIVRCTATNNGAAGILCGSNSVVSQCVSRLNVGQGILAESQSLVESCTSSLNQYDGIGAGFEGIVRHCTVFSNAGAGINVSSYMTISGNNVEDNTGDGIRVNNDCAVIGNTCRLNGSDAGDGAGIHALSNSNRIEANACTDNDRGIDIDGAHNVVVRNTCAGNTTNWTVVSGNVCLVVVATTGTAINGNAGGTAPGSTDPSANFTH